MEFLRRVVNDLTERNIDLGESAIVTPNRRAGLFIKKYMQQNRALKKPAWLPQLYAIQDFVSEASELDLLDRFSLIFRLYAVYARRTPNPKPFDTYYHLSTIILSDFEEIDLSLLDRDRLFARLRNISEMEKSFGDGGSLMKSFNQFAEQMSSLYAEFCADLLQRQQAYYGLALRTLVDTFDIYRFERWKKIVFAGFYALTKAERKLLELLTEHDRADSYWDIDRYYFEDRKQEAGYFLRENTLIEHSDSIRWLSDDLQSDPKKIEIIGTAGRVAQAKALGELLRNEADRDNDTAIVLPDESLLFPVLHSIPEVYKDINVTMGYPLKNTALYQLLSAIIDLHDRRGADPATPFLFRDVTRILLHPYILPMARDAIHNFVRDAQKRNRALIPSRDLQGFDSRIDHIFTPLRSVDAFIEYLKRIFKDIVESMKGDIHFSPEIEYIYKFYTSLQRIEDMLSEQHIALGLTTFWNLLREIIESTAVPFLGEPLKGLQIMGLLETRTLDFTRVYILSVNEGILPAGKSQHSFIPNEVRQGFGMETWAHRDSIYAYYFYRLLQRAEKVTIFYNTVHDAFGKGEKSRFIDQLLHEYHERNPRAEIEHRIVTLRPAFERAQPLSVEKDDLLLAQMKGMMFSPTRLQTYVDCPLKFYLRYILGLDEEDELLESADAKVFGSVIHGVLDRLYRPLRGMQLAESDLASMRDHYKRTVEEVYLEKMGDVEIEKGRNFLNCRIIETLIGNYLENEKPGKVILETEREFEKWFAPGDFRVKLHGTVDRIEGRDGLVDIIDFKTGIVNSLQFSLDEERSFETLLDELRKHGQVLQLLLYYYLAAEQVKADDNVRFRLGIYSFKEQRDTGKPRFLSEGRSKSHYLTRRGGAAHVETILKQIFDDLFDKGKPFEQADDEEKCGFCPYVEICGR